MLLAVSKATGQDCECIPQIATGLQGGLGVGEVCGAVSGAIMAIGLRYGKGDSEEVLHLAREFVAGFQEKNGAVRCNDLVGFDMGLASTGEDIGAAKDLMLYFVKGGKKKCTGFVTSATELVLEQLEDWES